MPNAKEPVPSAATVPCFDLSGQQSPDSASALRAFLTEHKDSPVTLSAAGLRRVDTLVIQEILIAARHWAARDLGFDLTDLPPRVADGLALIGLSETMLTGRAQP